MEKIDLVLDTNKHGFFYLNDGTENIGEMEVRITGKDLIVYHTQVAEKAEGKGFAKKILQSMVDYARKNSLNVVPLCPYVYAQFNRHPEDYADIWNKKESEEIK